MGSQETPPWPQTVPAARLCQLLSAGTGGRWWPWAAEDGLQSPRDAPRDEHDFPCTNPGMEVLQPRCKILLTSLLSSLLAPLSSWPRHHEAGSGGRLRLGWLEAGSHLICA